MRISPFTSIALAALAVTLLQTGCGGGGGGATPVVAAPAPVASAPVTPAASAPVTPAPAASTPAVPTPAASAPVVPTPAASTPVAPAPAASSPVPPVTQPPAVLPTLTTYTIGGTVSGLFGSGLVLQNNSADDLTVNANGSFTFSKVLSSLSGPPANGSYAVTVKTQPILPAQTCTVGSATGTVVASSVTTVTVTCVLALSAPKFAYVANLGNPSIQPYTINPTTGALAFVPGSPPLGSFEFNTPARTQPIAVAVDPSGRFMYGADFSGNSLMAYTLNNTTGKPTAVAGGTYPTGARLPYSVAADPSGQFVYVANQQDINGGTAGTISAFAINPTTGALTAVAGSPFTAGVTPFAVAVDPKGKFVYVANSGTAGAAGNVSAFRIAATGALTPVVGSPFAFGQFPLTLAVDPTGRTLVVTGTGGSLRDYDIDPGTGALTMRAPNAPGFANGVSVAFDPLGRFAFVASFSGKNILTLPVSAAGLLGVSPAIGPIPAGDGPVQVAVDPSGKFVYVANKTNGTIAGGAVSGFSINQLSGALTPLADPSVGAGIDVRGIALMPR